MTVGQVVFWAAIYVLGVAAIWLLGDRRRATRFVVLATWSGVGAIGTTTLVFACVATHYEHVPGMDGYCSSSSAATVAFFTYPLLALGFATAAGLHHRRNRSDRNVTGPIGSTT